MATASDEQLAQALVKMGVLTQDQLEQASKASQEGQVNVVQALLRLGYATAQDIARAAEQIAEEPSPRAEGPSDLELAEVQPHVPARRADGKVSLDSYEVDPEALTDVPKHVAEEYLVLPLQISQDRILVAMADANNVFAMDEIRSRTGRRVEPIEVDEVELRNAIDEFYAARARAQVQMKGPGTTDLDVQLRTTEFAGDLDQQLVEMLDQAPVVRIVEQILADAVRMRASDIHIEPRADQVRVRYRVDGQLMTVTQLPTDMHRYVISRIKIMAGTDIAETRFPQDGRFATEVDDRPIDLRVSTLPTYWGEKAVLRILDKSKALVSLNQLGMLPEVREKYERLIHSPQGMILITGPTGSGKSTLDRLQLTPEQAKKVKFHRGRGCAQCRNTGYQGRIGVYELMLMTDDLRDAIVAKADATELRRIALRNGMKSLKYDGLSKVNGGITSAAEVISILFASERM